MSSFQYASPVKIITSTYTVDIQPWRDSHAAPPYVVRRGSRMSHRYFFLSTVSPRKSNRWTHNILYFHRAPLGNFIGIYFSRCERISTCWTSERKSYILSRSNEACLLLIKWVLWQQNRPLSARNQVGVYSRLSKDFQGPSRVNNTVKILQSMV